MLSVPGNKHKSSAVDAVIHYILSLIKVKGYSAGTKLPIENEICNELNISRGPVREAMKIMHSAGIVEIKQGSGTYVAGDQVEPLVNPLLLSLYKAPWGFDELIELREMMDVLVYYTIIQNNDDETIAKCEAINQNLIDGVQQGIDNYTLYGYDIEFHRCMASCIKNPLLKKIYFFAYDFYESFLHSEYKDLNSVPIFNHSYHAQILEALKDRDLNAAVRGMYENMDYIKNNLNQIKKESDQIKFQEFKGKIESPPRS